MQLMTTQKEIVESEADSEKSQVERMLLISSAVLERVEHQIDIRRVVKAGPKFKKDWILDAFKEKLANDRENSLKNKDPTKTIRVSVDKTTFKSIDQTVEDLNATSNRTVTRSAWMVEAIIEKILRDQSILSEKLRSFS